MNLKSIFSFTIQVCALSLLLAASSFAQPQRPTATGEAVVTPKEKVVVAAPQEKGVVAPRAGMRASETAVDESVADDKAVEEMIAPYRVRVSTLSDVIGSFAQPIERAGIGGGTIGNFVADAIRAQAAAQIKRSVALAVTNYGGLRKANLPAGAIRVTDIYELLPFENALVTVDLTGTQINRLFQTLVAARDAQSGAVVSYKVVDKDKPEFAQLQLIDFKRSKPNKPKLINLKPDKLYTIVTSDYLVNRGGDYAALKEGVNLQPLNLTLRDAVIAYVKAETARKRVINPTLDRRFRRADADKNRDAKNGNQKQQPSPNNQNFNRRS